MRDAFVAALCRLAAEDERIVLLTGDLGYMVLDGYRSRFPRRFVNAGVSEQNMIGLSTGLAEAGLRPYAYSIAPFASLRPYEFIRNGPVLHRLPVRIVGVGSGFGYGHAGPTHYAVEDVGVLRTLPGLTVVVPADARQAARALQETAGLPGPVYYSLAKEDGGDIPGLEGRFVLGRLDTVRHGSDVAIICMGSIATEAVAAGEHLGSRGIRATIAIVSSFNPDPSADLEEILSEFPHAVTVEAQTVSGGLAALVGTVVASAGLHCRVRALAVRHSPDGTSGGQVDRWRKHGLDRYGIVNAVLAALGISE